MEWSGLSEGRLLCRNRLLVFEEIVAWRRWRACRDLPRDSAAYHRRHGADHEHPGECTAYLLYCCCIA